MFDSSLGFGRVFPVGGGAGPQRAVVNPVEQKSRPIQVQPLGQSGFRFDLGGAIVYTDPYLTDSVAEREGEDLRRLVPPPMLPHEVTDADWVLVSHEHLDHCDDSTLLPLSKASPQARFVAPAGVVEFLQQSGIPSERLVLAPEDGMRLAEGIRLTAVPAAHPDIERDAAGNLRFVGFVLQAHGRALYFAGDTSPAEEIVRSVTKLGRVDVAFVPVNERNHYKERRGIIGNMSVREALAFAEELGARTVVPMHYDMFQGNSLSEDEIRLVHRQLRPPFDLRFRPEVV